MSTKTDLIQGLNSLYFLFINFKTMSSVNFIKIFNHAADEIKSSLIIKYKKMFNEIKKNHYNSVKEKELKEKLDSLDKQRCDLITEISKLNDDLKLLDPQLTTEQKERSNKLDLTLFWWLWLSERNMRNSDLNTLEALAAHPVNINIQEFEKIRSKFINMLNLSVWSKEQRAVLLNFYSLDWKQLWVDVPPDLNIKDITISNWILNSGIKLL